MVNNVTGWTELVDGRIFDATTVLFTFYYGDWYITLLFLTFKIMLYLGTKSVLLGFITSIIFLGTFYDSLEPTIIITVVGIAVLELGAILYSIIFKK